MLNFTSSVSAAWFLLVICSAAKSPVSTQAANEDEVDGIKLLRSDDVRVRRQAAVLLLEVSRSADEKFRDPNIPDSYLESLASLGSRDIAYLFEQRDWQWGRDEKDRNTYNEGLRLFEIARQCKRIDLKDFVPSLNASHTQIVYFTAAVFALNDGLESQTEIKKVLAKAKGAKRRAIVEGLLMGGVDLSGYSLKDSLGLVTIVDPRARGRQTDFPEFQ